MKIGIDFSSDLFKIFFGGLNFCIVETNTPSYTNKQHSNKQFLNKQYSKLQQKLPIVSTCKLANLEFGLKFWHQILPIYLNDDFNNFA